MDIINPSYDNLIFNIVKKKIREKKYILPVNNELVIHLRLGDVVNHDNFLKKNYKKIIESYVEKYNISKVTFCTAYHYGNYTEKNMWIYDDDKHQKNILKLTEKLNNVMEIPNIYVNFISSNNPDNDFIYMVNAKYFVEDFGGFSKLISDVNND